jgi:CRISPR/Cas system-associated exonuclease Cas4 (RecB family)
MRGAIVLTPLTRTSPTLWAHMRLCSLRGAFAATRAVDTWILHDPRAWLGTAFHKVMAAAARPGAIKTDVEQVWTVTVSEAAAAAASHPLDARYAAPERWPNYFLVRQRALSSAQGLIARNTGTQRVSLRGEWAAGTERQLHARGGRLAGRPDRFDGRVVTEYKSSLPDPAWPGAQAVLDGFHRQLQLYAAIIAEAAGRWPERGRIIAASGQAIEVTIDQAVCEAEALAALDALDSLNRGLASGATAETLARPGNDSCGGCPFQAVCPAFWRWLAAHGSAGLPDTAAVGVLERVELGQDGDLYTAHVAINQPSMPPGFHPFVLRRTTHGDLTHSAQGARSRIVSARLKTDGRLRADASTCIFAEDDVPKVITAGQSGAPMPPGG